MKNRGKILKLLSEQVKYYHTACEKLKNRIPNLYTDKLDGKIDLEFYKLKNDEWTMEYARMKSFMESHENANNSYMHGGIKFLKLDKKLYPQYLRQNDYKLTLSLEKSNNLLV